MFGSFPRIRVLEAWNEPNDSHYSSYLPPAAAAGLMNAAYTLCQARGCTAIAGDLLDSEPNMVEYERRYERGLSPAEADRGNADPF